MVKFPDDYYERMFQTVRALSVTDRSGRELTLQQGIEEAVRIILSRSSSGGTVMFIGNGGSAAIASHMATDFSKNGGVKAMAFNDASLLTCLGNDYGYSHVFEKPVEIYASEGDVLIAISSSGRSENILLGVAAARDKGCRVITFSGFDHGNPLSSLGDVNFYVPSHIYGFVEVLHHSLCHCLLDTILSSDEKGGCTHRTA
ncbi:MAG: SIS domain-containing protein [Nitrospirae bacterium]|nr:SIS domain-containing protein [Nitrospirota bacterium]